MIRYFSILNKFLIVFIFCSFVYFCFKLFFSVQRTGVSFVHNDQAGRIEPLKGTLSVPEKAYDYYRKQVQKRDIFQFPEEKARVMPKKVQARRVIKASIKIQPKKQPFVKSLKLVGVVLDEDPEAIVENPKKKKTLFLRKGDEVQGAIVEKILEGKIIFLYEGRKVELVQ